LTKIFASRTSAEWIAFGDEHNTTIAPVNTPETILKDPQFEHRFTWVPKEDVDADMLGYPVKFEGGDLPAPGPAPSAGQHSEEVLREVAGYDEERIQKMREAGVLG